MKQEKNSYIKHIHVQRCLQYFAESLSVRVKHVLFCDVVDVCVCLYAAAVDAAAMVAVAEYNLTIANSTLLHIHMILFFSLLSLRRFSLTFSPFCIWTALSTLKIMTATTKLWSMRYDFCDMCWSLTLSEMNRIELGFGRRVRCRWFKFRWRKKNDDKQLNENFAFKMYPLSVYRWIVNN